MNRIKKMDTKKLKMEMRKNLRISIFNRMSIS